MRRAMIGRGRLLAAVGIVLVLAMPALTSSPANQNLLILSLVLAVSAVAANIMAGYAGYYSLGEAVPFGIGAYAVAILTMKVGGSPLVWLPAGALAAAGFALLVGLIASRGRGDTFIVLTMAALFLMSFLATQWKGLTAGPAGLTVPAPTWDYSLANWPFYYMLLVLLGVALLTSWRIRRSKLGMGLIAIREDEDRAAALGVNVATYKVVGFMASSILLSLAGGLYAWYAGFVNPTDAFSLVLSGQILLAVLLGGRGTLAGPVVGAVILTALDYYGNQAFGGGNARLLIVGGLFVAVMLFVPQGVVPGVLGRLAARSKGAAGREAAPRGDGAPADADAERVAAAFPRRPAAPAGAAATPILEVSGLEKRFGGVTAVQDGTFSVARGSITGLIGPNGSGKTTTFNLIDGTIAPDAGAISFDGERIDRLSRWARVHRGLARTFQSTRIFGEMTVLENVVAPLREFNWRHLNAVAVSGAEAARARELLDLVGLQHAEGLLAADLSYGEQKLVEFAQILTLEPSLIMLDEPAGGIDPDMVARMGELIKQLNARGISFLLVEHNMAFVFELSDAVVVLSQGAPVASGTPEQVQAHPAVIEAYVGKGFDSAQAVGV